MDNYPVFQIVETKTGYDLVMLTMFPNGNSIAYIVTENPDYDTFADKQSAIDWANANSGCVIEWIER